MRNPKFWLYVAYFIVLFLYADGEDMVKPRMWYYTMRGCQQCAELFGRAGIKAELAYREAMEVRQGG